MILKLERSPIIVYSFLYRKYWAARSTLTKVRTITSFILGWVPDFSPVREINGIQGERLVNLLISSYYLKANFKLPVLNAILLNYLHN